MLAMHSCEETVAKKDVDGFVVFMARFLESGVDVLKQTHDEMCE